MPIFKFEKLVRDGLPAEYERDGQKPDFVHLSTADHKRELIRKIGEEAQEVPIMQGHISDAVNEIADIQQALDDLIEVCGLDKAQIEQAMMEKRKRIGGFTAGIFVKTLELDERDEWTEYYRSRPDLFPEIE